MKKPRWINWANENPIKALAWIIVICYLAFQAFTLWMGYIMFRDPMCEAWHKGMTKDEKIRAFLEIVNDKPRSLHLAQFMNITSNASPYLIPYPDVDTILRSNPDCCRLYPDLITYDFEGMGGNQKLPPDGHLPPEDEGVVVVKYPAYIWKHNGLEKYIETKYQRLNLCKKSIF